MNKAHVLFFAIVSISLTLYGLIEPGFYINLLVSSSGGLAAIRMVAAVFMLLYVFQPQFRNYLTQGLMGSWGIVLIAFGVTTLAYPTLFGMFPHYIPLGDSLIFIEGGILASILSLELPVSQPVSGRGKLKRIFAFTLFQAKRLFLTARPKAERLAQ